MIKLTLTINIQIDQNRLIEVYERVSGGKSLFKYDGRNYYMHGGTFTKDVYEDRAELFLERSDKWDYPEAIFEPYRGKDCLP